VTQFIVKNLGENLHNVNDSECQPIALFHCDLTDAGKFAGYIFKWDYESESWHEKLIEVEKRDTRCYSFDDNGLIECAVSWVVDINIHGLNPALYIDENFFFFRVFRINPEIDFSLWSHTMIFNLLRMRKNLDYALNMIELLSYEGKSNFKNSLKNQVLSWLTIEPENQKFNMPLSNNQYATLTKYSRKY